ncbi:hypothetical protein ACFSHQ_27825 [Gemmobacter lanyuensis]
MLEAIRLTPADLPDLPEEKDRDGFALDRAAVALADFAAEMDRAGAPWFVLGDAAGHRARGGSCPMTMTSTQASWPIPSIRWRCAPG